MSAWQRIARGETTIDFVGLRRRWLIISATLIAISLLALGVRGLNLGLEFVGGVLVQSENPAGADIPDVRDALAPLGLEDSRIQLVDDGRSVRVQTEPLEPDAQAALVDAILDVTGGDREALSLEAVGPTFGELVAQRALTALLVFLGAAVLFMTWRLQWKMAVSGQAALVHDLVITVGIYALTGFEVTPATVIAVLTILGYSLYDTVVVFDKVREYEEAFGEELTYSQIVNRAMNNVLVRSLGTSLTSLIPVGSLLFVGSVLFGASSLQDFALALFVGIGVGTYSSIFVAAPLLAAWKEREPGWIAQRERLEERARLKGEAAPDAQPVPEVQPTPEPEPTTSQEAPPPTPGAGATPRPPKRRRR